MHDHDDEQKRAKAKAQEATVMRMIAWAILLSGVLILIVAFYAWRSIGDEVALFVPIAGLAAVADVALFFWFRKKAERAAEEADRARLGGLHRPNVIDRD